jgi:putative ABC transport system permease protein
MMARIRVAARLARREVQRRQGRTLLVVLLVAIPVAGMTIAAVVRETVALTPRESYRIWFGSSDMAVEGIGGPVALPPGAAQ